MAHEQPTGDEDDESEFDLDAPTDGVRVNHSPSTRREQAHRDDIRRGPISSVPRSAWRGSDGWAAYFPGEYEADETCAGRSVIVQTLYKFFLTDAGRIFLSSVPERSFALPLDYDSIRRPTAPSALQGIAAVIPTAPEEALPCIGLAASRAAEQICEQIPDGAPLPVTQDHRLWPRVYNFGPLTPLRSLKGNSVGRFVAVRGTVVRVSNIRQQVTAMQFECAKCGELFARTFIDYKFSPPTSCPTEKCRSRSFLPRRDTAETVDWQKIRVQEIIDQDDDGTVREEGRIPRSIDAELFADLIDSCIPGDTITVCGTVRVFSVDTAGGGGGSGSGAGGSAKTTKAGKCLYYLYIEANSTTSSRKSKSRSSDNEGLTFDTASDGTEASAIHNVIREVIREKDPFAFLVQSSVPSIYGHELVKAGMLLSLFGGSPKQRIGTDSGGSASGTVAIRRDVHCLVVGDPGLGKSQMLKAFTNIAPRGVYVCGNTTTTAGLTVTVVRESSGDFALEAGALVLGDMGVCCIDEFDKMGADHGALLEAMEQQSVSIAKAGMLCNLSARTTVIAAANPVGGHYDKSKTVCENLKIALPLLSRFDLVFILVDNPDEARDRFISEHVMAMFGMRSTERNGQPNRGPLGNLNGSNRKKSQHRHSDTDGRRHRGNVPFSSGSSQIEEVRSVEPLSSRLRSCVVKDPLPPSLFRQYIAYAKAYVHPELSEAAKSVLQEFYLTLRKGAHEQAADTTPITTRQLESLIRLSEARARSVMRTIVTESDARDVIEIMRESMLATLTDETGQVDLSRSTGMSRSKDARKFVAALHAESQRMRSAIFDKASLKRIAQSIGIDADGERFLTLIETINYQGYVTKKGHGKYELQSSSFSLTPTTRSLPSQQDIGSQQRSGSDQQQRGRRRASAGSSPDEYE
jgi:DNA helicase MCM8